MAELFRNESPVEFFKQQVEGAMQRQQLQASDWTIYYIVNLLASFVSPARLEQMNGEEALGMRLARAVGAEGGPKRDDLRRIADHSLFLAGFFGDSFQRRLVDLDYYISLGGYAYSRLAAHDDAFADVFGELAEKFVPVVDVLADISDRSRSTNRDVLRMYERWVRTGSQRDRMLLAAKGLTAQVSDRVQ